MYKLNWDLIFNAMSIDLVARLKEKVPVHDGDLKKSIRAKIIKNELQIYMLSYWEPVEFGSNPHWTSIDNLKKWAKDKLGDEKAAYGLQKHIAKYGTSPHPFIRPILDQDLKSILIKAIKSLGQKAIIKE